MALAPLNHIALACEPALILVAGSLYRLGQRRIQATVTRNRKPNKCLGFTSVGIVSERENLGVEDAQTIMILDQSIKRGLLVCAIEPGEDRLEEKRRFGT